MRFLIAAAICAIAILACGTTAVNAQVEPEISVLKFLANSTGGWENVSSGAWLVNTTHHACGVNGTRWSGIKCDHIGGIDHVVEIRFPSGIRINGSIELIELNPLRYLRSLQIWNTELTGSLPDLSTHPTLQSLLIGGNPKFSGPFTTKNIPPHLRRIEIRDRRAIMTDPFPSFDAVNNITLNYIRLQNVQINGTLPSFERFINLKEVYIQENKISGSVPRFGPSLRILSLTKNELSGFDVSSIPVTVQILELNRNRIIAPFPDLSKLTDPYRIELSENGFYGDVPLSHIPAPVNTRNVTDVIGEFSYLVNFTDNALSGSVPGFSTTWLQSRAAPGLHHKLRWSASCNFFQTGLPDIQPLANTCYDNKTECTRTCKRVTGIPTPIPTPIPTTPTPTQTPTPTTPTPTPIPTHTPTPTTPNNPTPTAPSTPTNASTPTAPSTPTNASTSTSTPSSTTAPPTTAAPVQPNVGNLAAHTSIFTIIAILGAGCAGQLQSN